MCFALYLRDCAGLGVIGQPAVSPVKPPVHCVDPHQVVHAVGGMTALRVEWEAWWYELVACRGNGMALPTPPDFPEFDAMPALQRFTHAHYGTALTWTQEREDARRQREPKHLRNGSQRAFGDLVQERELELGRPARNFALAVIELPLSECRAWYVEPDMLILCEDLYDDEAAFRSYVQPVVEIIA
jgi:predicted metal-binding protein